MSDTHLDGGSRVSQWRDGDPGELGGLKVWPRIGPDRGSVDLSLEILELAEARAHRTTPEAMDEVLFVLEGRGSAALDGDDFELEAGDGLYLPPGRQLRLQGSEGAPLVLASARTPAESTPGRTEPPPTGSGVRVRLADQAVETTGDRGYSVLVGKPQGSHRVTQFVGSIPPGRAPEHFHHYEELICILEGEGRMWSGASSTPIARGSCIYLPKRQPHCLENTGTGPLVLMGVFYPSGSPAVRYDT